MIRALLEVVCPVFLVAAVGWLYAGRRRVDVAGLTDLIIYLASDCLIFDAMSKRPPFALSTLRVPIAASLVVLSGLALGQLLVVGLARRRGCGTEDLRGLRMPVAFINSGNLGLPLASLAFGEEGLAAAVAFFVTHSIWQHSAGVAIAKGEGGLRELLRLPLLYATALGLLANQLQLRPPAAVAVPIGMIGSVAIPLMLLALGAQLRNIPLRSWRLPVTIAALRLGGGFLAALAVNRLMGNEGTIARVTLLCGSLPPAVMNFALAEKYDANPGEVSGAILVGTAMGLVTIPAVLWYLSG